MFTYYCIYLLLLVFAAAFLLFWTFLSLPTIFFFVVLSGRGCVVSVFAGMPVVGSPSFLYPGRIGALSYVVPMVTVCGSVETIPCLVVMELPVTRDWPVGVKLLLPIKYPIMTSKQVIVTSQQVIVTSKIRCSFS